MAKQNDSGLEYGNDVPLVDLGVIKMEPVKEPTQSLGGIAASWPHKPPVIDLDNCTITFRGQTVPGERLAELLGMGEPAALVVPTKREK